jgi:DNA-binding LytR/AlgR family response regulator
VIRLLVVEDEPLARKHLADLLAEFPGVEVVAQAANVREALAAVAAHHPAIVFVTAYPQHAIEAFAGGAVHYLLKPISRVGIAQALSRIRPKDDPLQKAWLRIPVRRRTGTRLLDPGEVEALVADLGDCSAWTTEGPLPVDGTLAHWEERLAGHGFLRVHRNALVRLGAVRELAGGDELVLGSGRLAISRRRMEEVRRALGL